MRKTVIFCIVLFAFLGICQSSLGSLVPELRAHYRLSTASAGLLVSVFFVGLLAGTVACGAVREKWVRPGFVVIMISFVTIGLAGMSFAPTWALNLTAVSLIGFGFGNLALLVNTYTASRPGRTGLALVNLVNGAFGIGATVGPLLVGVTLALGYRNLLLALGAAMLFSLPVLRVAREPRQATPGAAGTAQRAVYSGSSARLVLFGVMCFCYAGLETGLSSWEAVFMRGEGYSLSEAASVTSLFWLGLAGARLLARALAVRWSAPRIVMTSLVGSLGALAMIGLPATAPVGFLLAGFFAGPILPSALAWMTQTVPSPRRGNAVVMAGEMLGGSVLTAAIGLGIDVFSLGTLPVLVGITAAVSLTAAGILHVRDSQGSDFHAAARGDVSR
jgi:MFS transporter, FHS family, glucose/mannose:H+ symporter